MAVRLTVVVTVTVTDYLFLSGYIQACGLSPQITLEIMPVKEATWIQTLSRSDRDRDRDREHFGYRPCHSRTVTVTVTVSTLDTDLVTVGP